MDGLTFHKVIRIVKSRYLNANLNKVTVLGDQLCFSFYTNKKTEVILFQSTPPPTLEMTSNAVGEANGALSILSGATLTDVGCRPYDRLGYFEFQKRRPSGKLVKHKIMLEPMGNYSNAFLLNDEGVILYQLSARSIDPDRDIGVGGRYTEPRLNKRYHLDNIGAAESFGELAGFYPVTIKEAERYQEEIGFKAAAELIRAELANDDHFYIQGKHIFPFAPKGETADKIAFEQLSLKRSNVDNSDQELKRRISKLYTKQLEHYKKLKIKLADDLNSALAWESSLQEADLLKSNMHKIRGKGVYKLTRYTEDGAVEVEYDFNADVSLTKHVESLYNRAARLKRALPAIEERVVEVDQLIKSAEEQLFYVESADTKELKELVELSKPKPQNRKERVDPTGIEEHRLGETLIYIGKNSAGNHRLVFQFANADDTWLHAQNIPSAHAIIRKDGEITDEELQFAANLVAGRSKHKNEAKVLVDYTLKKYVKKPRNTPVGFVVYTHFKTIM
ncbi:MAG: NFACT RNA binding domain-containing protein, partial [Deferribacteraceae bacterium]|nr:NFACT RNA binding domain-containing protein [Deferribacteraceae bacterium]